uniref:K Homology domain-containing protein n=1 Tax=Ascaris lumbricoides TaxID=6252 RepID=A0A9J2Q4H4_ASCLU
MMESPKSNSGCKIYKSFKQSPPELLTHPETSQAFVNQELLKSEQLQPHLKNGVGVGQEGVSLQDSTAEYLVELLKERTQMNMFPRTFLHIERLIEEGVGVGQEGVSLQDSTAEYLVELLKERTQMNMFPRTFLHIERLIEEEINRVQLELFQFSFSVEKPNLPAPKGQPIVVQEKVYIPTKEHPDYNFVGRILGPRGMTAKQLEVETGCRIMVRGRGSMRDTGREEKNRGKPNWEHLNDELHVLIQCEDTPNRAHLKLKGAVSEIKKLLIPAPFGKDDLKRKQLMELAIINGTYRPVNKIPLQNETLLGPMAVMPLALHSPVWQSNLLLTPRNKIVQTPNFAYDFHVNSLAPGNVSARSFASNRRRESRPLFLSAAKPSVDAMPNSDAESVKTAKSENSNV